MGVYIPNMKMPKSCWDCLLDTPMCDLWRNLKHSAYEELTKKRHEDCPLIEVPVPHGRLIDADALRHSLIKRWIESENDNENYKYAFEDVDEVVRKAQTVYPASADFSCIYAERRE